MSQLYYTPPTQEAFDDMKAAALQVWKRYDDPKEYPGGYYGEKVARIKDIQNVQDNFMYMFAMFDIHNQAATVRLLSEPTKEALRERLMDGGMEEFNLTLIGL